MKFDTIDLSDNMALCREITLGHMRWSITNIALRKKGLHCTSVGQKSEEEECRKRKYWVWVLQTQEIWPSPSGPDPEKWRMAMLIPLTSVSGSILKKGLFFYPWSCWKLDLELQYSGIQKVSNSCLKVLIINAIVFVLKRPLASCSSSFTPLD